MRGALIPLSRYVLRERCLGADTAPPFNVNPDDGDYEVKAVRISETSATQLNFICCKHIETGLRLEDGGSKNLRNVCNAAQFCMLPTPTNKNSP